MGYVFMKDVPQVQTVGADGRSMYPPSAVHMPETVDETGRYQEVSGSRDEIPNPAAATDGQVVKATNGLWGIGADEAGSGSGSSGSGGSSGSSGIMVVHEDVEDTGALDKTWQELRDAFDNGVLILLRNSSNWAFIDVVMQQSEVEYMVLTSPKIHPTSPMGDFIGEMGIYVTDAADGYPVYSEISLNNVPLGGSGDSDIMILHMDEETGTTLDKTAGDIMSAVQAGKDVVVLQTDTNSNNGGTSVMFQRSYIGIIQDIGPDYDLIDAPARYVIVTDGSGGSSGEQVIFLANSLDDYPVLSEAFDPGSEPDPLGPNPGGELNPESPK